MKEVTGNTYQAREVLKVAGFTWMPQYKCWLGTDAQAVELERITASAYSRANQKAIRGIVMKEVEICQ